MLRHLPVIVVVAPLLSAPLCILSNRFMPARLIALGTCLLTLACAITMLAATTDGFIWRYELGGWAAPWGIVYRVDAFSALLVLLIAGIASVVVLFSGRLATQEIAGRETYFFALFMLACAGFFGVVVTGDLFNIFVFLEICALASYALVGLKGGDKALLAAYRYLLMGSVGATFFLIGIGYLYMMTGTLNLEELATQLPGLTSSRTVLAAMAFIGAGLAMKIALFPLHWWLPNAYTFSFSPVSALLAALSTKVSIYLFIRLFFGVFGIDAVAAESSFDVVLFGLSSGAIFFASVAAIYQDDVRRIMAYSSISQIGFIMLGVSLVSTAGIGASVVYLFNHALIKCGLFLALGCVVYRFGSCRIVDFEGLGKRMPWTMAAIVIGGLSLVGVPLTAGFVGKWQLISVAFEANRWLPVLVVLAGSLLSLVYVWRLTEAAYLPQAPSVEAEKNTRCEAPAVLLVPVWLLIALNIYIGIDSSNLIRIATQAARGVVGE